MTHKRRKTVQSRFVHKDEEERRLESILFGVPFQKGDPNPFAVISDSGTHLKELENMLDSDLFFIDDNAGSASIEAPSDDVLDKSDSDARMELEEEPHEEVASDDPTATVHAQQTSGSDSRSASAWVDPDDADIQVSLASHTRLRKLRDAPAEDTVGGREYERRLRRQYEQINPTPDWASKARKKLHAKRRRSASGSELEDENIIPDLLASTGGISGGRKPKVLSSGIISVDHLRDANQAAPAEGEIKSVQFHPSSEIPVLLTASADRRLRLFHVDGLTNPHKQTLHIPSLPITHAVFHPTGSSILLTGPRPFYYTYDLQSGTSHRSPRGLWGTTFTNDQPQQGSMDMCAFSPTGDILAIAGRHGHIHLVDWRSGAAQVIASLKANAGIRSLWWSRSGDGPSTLLSLTENAQVYVWDVGQRRCVKRWQDEGGFGSRIIGGDLRGGYLAIGSNTGLVNVYSAESTVSLATAKPKPLKTLGNLTTNISCLRYNHDAQLLAMASNVKKDHMRLVHLPSLTAFANWPTSSTPLGHVTSIDFSAESEYLAIGNNRGRVLLYQLRDYGAQ